jgi:hypothetical protein
VKSIDLARLKRWLYFFFHGVKRARRSKRRKQKKTWSSSTTTNQETFGLYGSLIILLEIATIEEPPILEGSRVSPS